MSDWRSDPALAHLRDDAPYVVCAGCGRKSWGGNPAGSRCEMPQPNGTTCQGTFGVPETREDDTQSWFYLSFATDDDGFLGGAYVRGDDEVSALARATTLGLNPGGEVAIVGPLPPDEFESNVLEADRERMLTREEIELRGGRT